MGTPMDEEQMSFLGELLGDTTIDGPTDGAAPQTSAPAEQEEQKEEGELDIAPPAGEVKVEEPAQVDAPEIDQAAILREQIVKLTEQLQKDPLQQAVEVDVKTESAKADEKKQEVLKAFLTDDEIDRIIDEPQLLNTAFNRAISVMQQNMQGAIQAEVNRQVMVSRAVSDFYTSNQDLAPYGKFVQFVMAEIEQQNPTKTYAEIFQMTADESRKRLGLGSVKTVERQQSQPNQQKPAFAGSKKSTARPAGKQEFFDPNAADMMNLL